MKLKLAAVAAVALVGTAEVAAAQFLRYRPPGEFEEQRESMEQLLERSMQEAQWRLGPFLIDPWLGIRDLGYVDEDNVRGSDFTATIGAGLRFYLPIGREVTFAAHALPEYSLWLENTERNTLGGRYGLGIFANMGRTGLEISVSREEREDFFSDEINRRLNTVVERGVLSLEVELGRGVALFGAAEPRRYEFPQREQAFTVDLESLVRDEFVYRAGLRIDLPRELSLSIGAESSEADFDSTINDRSNSGVSPLLQASYGGGPVRFSLNVALRELDPEAGSSFISHEEPSGSFQISWHPRPRWELQLFGGSDLVYAADINFVYYQDEGVGMGVQTSLSQNASLRVFYQVGVNDYVGAEGVPRRRDDLSSLGGNLNLHLGRGIVLRISGYQTDYEPVFGGASRRSTVIGSGVSFGAASGSPWG